jgi:hypothetical protein
VDFRIGDALILRILPGFNQISTIYRIRRPLIGRALPEQRIAEIQRALPGPIRARARRFRYFSAGQGTRKAALIYLGIFEGYSLMEGCRLNLMKMPRITLFIDSMAQAADHRRKVFLREVQGPSGIE